jgi:hypothetical protein
VDVEMLRRSWPDVLERVKAVLKAVLESATPVAYDGASLELAFPPTRKFGVAKVEEREEELRAVLQEVFGIAPRIRCVVREAVTGPAVEIVEDSPPMSEEAVLARLKSEFDATEAPEPEGWS